MHVSIRHFSQKAAAIGIGGNWTFCLFASLFLAAHVASGGVFILDEEDWGGGGDTKGWGSLNGTPTDSPTSGGVPSTGGYLAMHMPGTPVPVEDLFTTGPSFVGDYSQYADVWVSFDLRVTANDPRRLFFEASPGGVFSRWEFSPLSGAINTWENYRIPFLQSAGWTLIGGSGSFDSALTKVDAIGLTFTHFGAAADYGLDNFRRGYTVPEPSEILALLASLSSLSFVFRGRLSVSAGRLFAIFRRAAA